jgi:flagellar protein FlaG
MEIAKVQGDIAMGKVTTATPITKESKSESKVVPETNYSFDREANVFVIKFIDPESKEVVRQIPPKEMIEIAKEIGKMQGNVIDERA